MGRVQLCIAPRLSKAQKPCCLHDKWKTLSATHTNTSILIVVSLLQGEKIGYLRVSLTYLFPSSSSATNFPFFSSTPMLDFLHIICFEYFLSHYFDSVLVSWLNISHLKLVSLTFDLLILEGSFCTKRDLKVGIGSVHYVHIHIYDDKTTCRHVDKCDVTEF